MKAVLKKVLFWPTLRAELWCCKVVGGLRRWPVHVVCGCGLGVWSGAGHGW